VNDAHEYLISIAACGTHLQFANCRMVRASKVTRVAEVVESEGKKDP